MNPDDLHPADRRRSRRYRDLAFGGFLYVGVMLALGLALRWVPPTLPGYWHLGSFLSYPALVLSVPAVLLGLTFTVVVRRERPLWLLTLLIVAVAPVIVSIYLLPDGWGWLASLFFALLMILSVALPLDWFLRRRRPWSRLSKSEARTELERGW